MQTFDITFADIDWGEDDAKNDESLAHYFVEFPGYKNILKGKKRYVIGRKGTGKSAILQKIRLHSIEDPSSYHTDISLRDFPLGDFKSLGDRSLQDKSKYVSAWKFLLLTEIANLIVNDPLTKYSDEIGILRKFLQDNFPDGISMAKTITRLKETQNKVGITLSIHSNDEINRTSTESTSLIHYNKAVKCLEELLSKIQTNSTFILLIDELDEGYRIKNINLNLVILSLLRATDELFHFFKKQNINCIPVLALRSDIFDNLEDNDLNKLDDYVLRLNWTTNEKSPWSLKQIAEKRIEAAVKEKYPSFSTTDYWSLVADDKTAPKGLWQYICVLTFSRPRDIIKILKYCTDVVKGAKLTLSDVQAIEEDYSSWFYREFRDEVQSFLPCWKNALNCICEVAQGKENTEILLARFDANVEISTWCKENKKTSLDVVKTLFNYSVIGCVNDVGRWIFKYKDESFEFLSSYPYYCVHYGFCRKLRIPKSYDRMIIEVIYAYK